VPGATIEALSLVSPQILGESGMLYFSDVKNFWGGGSNCNLARYANLPEGLYILLMFV